MLDSKAQASIEKLLLEKSLSAGLTKDVAEAKIKKVISVLSDPSQTAGNSIINELVGIVMMEQSEQTSALVELALRIGSQMPETLSESQKATLDSLKQG